VHVTLQAPNVTMTTMGGPMGQQGQGQPQSAPPYGRAGGGGPQGPPPPHAAQQQNQQFQQVSPSCYPSISVPLLHVDFVYLRFCSERQAVGRTGQFVLYLQMHIKFHCTEGNNSCLQILQMFSTCTLHVGRL